MQATMTRKQEAVEDIFFGQIVLIWARWFVIAGAGIFALWTASSVNQLTIAILLIAVMMGINFFVHGRYLMEKPINHYLLLALSFVDMAIITLILVAWPSQRGLASFLFVLYYPMLTAFAFVFRPEFTAVYTIITLTAYIIACLIGDSSFVADPSQVELLIMRLITLASMGGLATYYWRIQRERRRAGNR